MMFKRFALVVVLILVLIAAVACGSNEPAVVEPTPGEATGLDGAAILQEKCTTCHSLDRVTSAEYDDVGWAAVIDDMIAKGATLTTDEAAALAEYLSLQ